MKRIFLSVFIILFAISCSKEKGNLTVSGHVKGLKKGTLYLQKINDTILATVDSLVVHGNSDFSFTTHIDEPEVLYLYLDKNDGNVLNDQVEFFAEPGNITIHTTVDNFLIEAQIEGSENHKVLEDYKKMLSNFTDKNLGYIKESFEAKKSGDSITIDSIQKLSDKNFARRYLYTVNYAMQNKDKEVAPYIVLNNAGNISLKYLDSINNSLSSEVASSKYGVALSAYIQKIKDQESQTGENK